MKKKLNIKTGIIIRIKKALYLREESLTFLSSNVDVSKKAATYHLKTTKTNRKTFLTSNFIKTKLIRNKSKN